MRELCEFRIDERDAQRFLRPEDGEPLGLPGAAGVRKLLLDTKDPRFARMGEIERQYRAQGVSFFSSWDIRRKYTRAELDEAELFHLRVRATREPEGERCGTRYDDSESCPQCGAGARQLNELRLDSSRLPRARDMTRTIAGSELLFSARLVEAFRQNGMTGARFHPVLDRGASVSSTPGTRSK